MSLIPRPGSGGVGGGTGGGPEPGGVPTPPGEAAGNRRRAFHGGGLGSAAQEFLNASGRRATYMGLDQAQDLYRRARQGQLGGRLEEGSRFENRWGNDLQGALGYVSRQGEQMRNLRGGVQTARAGDDPLALDTARDAFANFRRPFRQAERRGSTLSQYARDNPERYERASTRGARRR